jgi:hypothetical protein
MKQNRKIGKNLTGAESPDRRKSHISYKPYGEILRTDSGGPDITKFKYTGQVEDKETGLMYYKARYYRRAPKAYRRKVRRSARFVLTAQRGEMVARFTQADTMVFNDQVSGMNRYMYVSGNPVKYRDPSGHKQTRGWLGGLIHDFNKWSRIGQTDYHKFMANQIKGFNKLTYRILNGGKSRNNNDLDKNLKTGNFFGGRLAPLSKFFTHLRHGSVGPVIMKRESLVRKKSMNQYYAESYFCTLLEEASTARLCQLEVEGRYERREKRIDNRYRPYESEEVNKDYEHPVVINVITACTVDPNHPSCPDANKEEENSDE